MKLVWVGALLCAIGLSTPTFACDPTTTTTGNVAIGDCGGSVSQSSARSQSHSSSTARATGGKGGSATANANPSQTVNVNGSGGGRSNGAPAATAAPPAVMSFNPCSGSPASGGVQTGLFGFAVGTGGGFDNACRLHMLGQDAAAVAYLCRGNDDIRRAFQDIGQPCPQDRREARPTPVAMLEISSDRPDYCLTASPGELMQHRECRRHATAK